MCRKRDYTVRIGERRERERERERRMRGGGDVRDSLSLQEKKYPNKAYTRANGVPGK